MSTTREEISKLDGYVALAHTDERTSKLSGYSVLAHTDERISKALGYVVLNNTAINPVPSYGVIPIFPDLPEGFPVNVDIVMDTTLGTTKSLREMRVAQQVYPLWDIELLFNELRDQTQNQTPYAPFVGFQQYEELVQLWISMYGQTNVFGFNCPWDNSRSAQLIGTGDGTTLIFPTYRTWGLGLQETIAPVGLINTVTQVAINGIGVSPSTYDVSRDSIVFHTAPGFGLAITVTFSYYYLCRFVEDEQDFEEFAKNRWVVPSLKFRAVIWV